MTSSVSHLHFSHVVFHHYNRPEEDTCVRNHGSSALTLFWMSNIINSLAIINSFSRLLALIALAYSYFFFFFLPKLIIVVSCPLDRKHRNDPRVDKLSRRKEIGDFQKNPLLLFLRKKMNIKNIAECH